MTWQLQRNSLIVVWPLRTLEVQKKEQDGKMNIWEKRGTQQDSNREIQQNSLQARNFMEAKNN